jgi:hypothetical protein
MRASWVAIPPNRLRHVVSWFPSRMDADLVLDVEERVKERMQVTGLIQTPKWSTSPNDHALGVCRRQLDLRTTSAFSALDRDFTLAHFMKTHELISSGILNLPMSYELH